MAIQSRYGGLKIVWHPEKLKALLNKEITAPIYIRIKPTNKCNHHCEFCSYDPKTGDIKVRDEMKNRLDEIPKEKIMEILKDLKDMGVRSVTYSGGGEPLIYPYIEEVLKKTLEYGIDLSIITNGQNLKGEVAKILGKAKWVRVSCDAGDAKTFSKVRKVPESWFDELADNLRNFAKIKNKKCEFGINFVIHKDNYDKVYDSVKFFKELGVNHIKLTPMWIDNFFEYHNPTKDRVIEQIERARKDFQDDSFAVYDTYKGDFAMTSVAERKCSRCYIMQINPVIGADSRVYFCHDKAYSSSGVLGSIKNQSFKELWFSEEAKKKFLSFNPIEYCKHHCAGDAKNIFINDAISCFGDHINFP